MVKSVIFNGPFATEKLVGSHKELWTDKPDSFLPFSCVCKYTPAFMTGGRRGGERKNTGGWVLLGDFCPLFDDKQPHECVGG